LYLTGLTVVAPGAAAQLSARTDVSVAGRYVWHGISRAAGLVAVTRGSNTVRFIQNGKTVTVSGYRAGPGYNLATGVGTIDAARFIQELRALRASSSCPAGEDDHGRGSCEK